MNKSIFRVIFFILGDEFIKKCAIEHNESMKIRSKDLRIRGYLLYPFTAGA